MNFHELGLKKALLRTLEEIGHTEPTPIQAQAIPVILEGRDVVGLAQTGTGKTAAFLLPLLQRQNRPNHKGKFRPIRTLVITPTRELAAQIYEKAREYGKSLNLRSQCTVGGVPIAKQEHMLKRGGDVLIATPGRLLDLAKRGSVNFDYLEAIVLDEADHMLDIGFLPDVKRIIAQVPQERQTLLFSATMPAAIESLASQYLKDPVTVSVAPTSSVAERIDQSVLHVATRQKPNELVSLLSAQKEKRAVVFARTKHGCDRIVRRLKTVEIEAAAIHGNKTQGQRERALKSFANGQILVLVATDIAARGIDIKDVGLVVNYELPNVPEVYIHRIGRTARAGASGIAVSLCSDDEVKHLRSIEKLIGTQIAANGNAIEPAHEAPAKKPRKRPRKRIRTNSVQKAKQKSEKAAPSEDNSKSEATTGSERKASRKTARNSPQKRRQFKSNRKNQHSRKKAKPYRMKQNAES